MGWRDKIRQIRPLDIVVVAFTIVGINAVEIWETIFPSYTISPFVKFLLTGVIVIFFGYAAAKKEFIVRHNFPEGSAKEANFFKEWYSRPGTLHIFSRELTWLDTEPYAATKHVLEQKARSKELRLYVKDHLNHHLVQELYRLGAKLYPVRPDINSNHRFSVRVDGNISSIIIRNTETEPQKITFEEYANHEALVNLALDMTKNCYKRNRQLPSKKKWSRP